MLAQLHTYPADMDLEQFHEKWIPKQSLPAELAGDLPPIAEMHAAFRQELVDMAGYFVAEERHRATSDAGKTGNGGGAGRPQVVHQFGGGQLDID